MFLGPWLGVIKYRVAFIFLFVESKPGGNGFLTLGTLGLFSSVST